MKDGVFQRITIIGLGLIGSSIARAARAEHLADIIVGCDDEMTLKYARSHKFIDVPQSNPAKAIETSQLIILAVPPSALDEVAKKIAPALKPGMIVMDVASVKEAAIAAIAPHIPKGVDFIPAHPIAGSDQSGVAAGRADLFEKKRVIITPDQPDQTASLKTITKFWGGMGAKLEGMPANVHDVLYAYVSHLPQLLSSAAFSLLEPGLPTAVENPVLDKFLRLSRSNMALWVDIFSANSSNVIAALDRYLDALMHMHDELLEAPEGSAHKEDLALARNVLFPRIAASCLITTVMEAEKKAGFSFARFTGTGFADVASPAMVSPENDIETISGHFESVAAVLKDYALLLKTLRAALVRGDKAKLLSMLSRNS